MGSGGSGQVRLPLPQADLRDGIGFNTMERKDWIMIGGFVTTMVFTVGLFFQGMQSINSRFDSIDRRFDAVDLRFDAVDRRFELIEARILSIEEHLRSSEEAAQNK